MKSFTVTPEQWKHQNSVLNLFNVNNKGTRPGHLRCFGVYIVNFEQILTLCSSVLSVDVQPVNAGWEIHIFKNLRQNSVKNFDFYF